MRSCPLYEHPAYFHQNVCTPWHRLPLPWAAVRALSWWHEWMLPSAPLGPAGPLISEGEPSLPDTQPHHRAGHSHTGVSCRIQSHLLTPSFLTHRIPLRPHPRVSQRLVLLPSLQDGSHHHLYFDESSLRREIRHFLYKSRGCKGEEAASGSGFGLTSMKMYLVETSDSWVE